jgi:hypothetical protein
MKKIFQLLPALAVLVLVGSCKKEDYSFGEIKAPKDLTITTEIVHTVMVVAT